MLTVHRVRTVVHLFHPTDQRRRATFVDLGDAVRYTLYGVAGRKQEELTREQARSRWEWLRGLGYRKWEELS